MNVETSGMECHTVRALLKKAIFHNESLTQAAQKKKIIPAISNNERVEPTTLRYTCRMLFLPQLMFATNFLMSLIC